MTDPTEREKRLRDALGQICNFDSEALLDLDAKGVLVPHGIGNSAREIISEFLAVHEPSDLDSLCAVVEGQ